MDTKFNRHDSEFNMLRYSVIEPINGRTDWYTVAGFEYSGDAHEYADWRNLTRDPMDYPLEVIEVGTRTRPV